MAQDADLRQIDPPDVYWAAQDYGTEEGRKALANSIYGRVRRYYEALPNTYAYQTWTKALNVFHSLPGWYNPFSATVLGRGGSQGQNVSARVNLTGSMARSVIALLLQYLPEPDPSPVNTDVDSLQQVSLVKQFLDKYVEEAGVKQMFADVTKLAEIYGMAFGHIHWDPYGGRDKMEAAPLPPQGQMGGPGAVPGSSAAPEQPSTSSVPSDQGAPQVRKMVQYTAEDGQQFSRPEKTGELCAQSFSPLDVPFDLSRQNDDFDWLMVPWDINRYDLVALFPEAKEAILAYTARDEATALDANINRLEMEKKSERIADRDQLRLWICYHKPTPAVPDGLVATVLGNELLFTPGPLPYSRIPVILFRHGHIDRTPFGDSLFHQVLGLQDTYDDICSSIITNLTAFSKQLVVIPRTADFSVAELTDGLAAIEYDNTDGTGGKPEGLQLVKIAPEAFRFVEETLPKICQDITGLNQATRGSPPPSWSGTLNEQVKAMALSYQNEAHNDLLRGCKESYNLMLEILQNFIDEPIVIELAGVDGTKEVQSFTKDQFKQTRRVDVKLGAAFLKDQEAKLDAARELGRLGLVDGGGFLEVMESGSLRADTDDDLAVHRAIRAEEEAIVKGTAQIPPPPVPAPPGVMQPPPAPDPLIRDWQNDLAHIKSHAKRQATLDNSVPEQAQASQQLDWHIASHIQKWMQKTQQTPGLLQAIGQPPYPFPPPPMMPGPGGPPGAPGGPPGQSAPGNHPGSRPPAGQPPGPVTPSGEARPAGEPSTK